MTRTGLINGLAAGLAVIAAVATTTVDFRAGAVEPITAPAIELVDVTYVEFEDGVRGVVDATGAAVRIAPYRRIVSGSTAADWLLSELSSPGRVLAYTERSATSAPWKHRFAGKQTVAALSNIEALLAMKPDLVIAESLGDTRRIERLREHGLAVFDIGAMRGTRTLLPAMRRLGALLGHPERGALLARRFRGSLEAIAADLPPGERRQAAYVTIYGDKLYGGTRGTTYHDIVRHAGLEDAAAARYRDWPEYSAEQLIALDPELIVTRRGMGVMLCRQPGLDRLRACRTPGSIVELEGFVLDDPGLGILESAEALHDAVYGAGPGKP
jgi:iron complex transport system substrate-binding protein